MDIQLPKRPWYIKYRFYLIGGTVLVALIVYAVILQLGPRTLQVEIVDEQIAEVTEGEFLEYVETRRHYPCPVEPESIGGDGG